MEKVSFCRVISGRGRGSGVCAARTAILGSRLRTSRGSIKETKPAEPVVKFNHKFAKTQVLFPSSEH